VFSLVAQKSKKCFGFNTVTDFALICQNGLICGHWSFMVHWSFVVPGVMLDILQQVSSG